MGTIAANTTAHALTPGTSAGAAAEFSGFYPVLESWLVDGEPCGLSIREAESPITGNSSRFLPHAIL